MELVTVVYLLSNFVIMFAVERIMGVFFDKRRTPFIVMAFSYLGFFVFTSTGFLLWNIPIVSISISITSYFIITLNYESSMKKRVVATFGAFAIMLIVELSVVMAIGFYQEGIFDTVGADSMLGFILWGFTSYIMALFFRKFKNIKKNTIDASRFMVFYSVILFSTLVMSLFAIVYLPQGVAAITAILILLRINIFTLCHHDTLSAVYDDKLKSALHTQEKEYYFAQCQLMQDSVENIKTIRHDMKFHLAAAMDFTAKGKADEATAYLGGLLGDIEKNEIYSNTNNIAFDSIINFKLNDVKQKNIKLDIRILIPPVLNIEVADIVTILGNLLDNAIDAVAKVDEKVIKLDIEYSKESLFIQVENTFDGEVKHVKNDGVDKIIATRKDKDYHGYGLKNIRKSVDKYHGHVDISHEDNVFSVGVLLYI